MCHEGPYLNAVMSWGQRSRNVSQRIGTTLSFVSVGCNVLYGFQSFRSGFFFTLLITTESQNGMGWKGPLWVI